MTGYDILANSLVSVSCPAKRKCTINFSVFRILVVRSVRYQPAAVKIHYCQGPLYGGVTMGWLLRLVTGGPLAVKVKFSHTRYRALGPELIPVYRQSARR